MFFKSVVAAVSAMACLSAAVPVSNGAAPQVIKGSYIIKLKDNAPTASHLSWVSNIHARSAGNGEFAGVEKEYNSDAFHGYAGHFDKATIEKIENSPEVEYVEEDQIWYLEDVMEKRALTTQNPSTWGLAGVSHRQPGASGYIYDTKAGEGTFAYIVDSGIRTTHREFEGRAIKGYTAFPGDETDRIGHGTHVAGTVGGKTFGVAKKATLIDVKVFQGSSGSTSTILGGFDWAVSDIISKNRQDKAAINLSLGGPRSQVWNDAIKNAFNEGVVSVVAAGNSKVNASGFSPASAPEAITVGAVNDRWEIATGWGLDGKAGSNFGAVLDIFAPGDKVESASHKDDTSSAKSSGTSMATPHVCGLVLYAISVDGVRGPQALTDHLINNSGKDVVKGSLGGSPNRMANNANTLQ